MSKNQTKTKIAWGKLILRIAEVVIAFFAGGEVINSSTFL